MPLIIMLVTLSGSYGFTGGAPVIQGFKTIAACERAIPTIRQFYGKGTVKKAQCFSLASE
jgi:hypothetical protein